VARVRLVVAESSCEGGRESAERRRAMFKRTKVAVVIHAGRITKDRRCYFCGLVSSHGHAAADFCLSSGVLGSREKAVIGTWPRPIRAQPGIKSAQAMYANRVHPNHRRLCSFAHTHCMSNRYPDAWDTRTAAGPLPWPMAMLCDMVHGQEIFHAKPTFIILSDNYSHPREPPQQPPPCRPI